MEKMDNSGAVFKLLFVRRWGIFDLPHFGGVPFPLIAACHSVDNRVTNNGCHCEEGTAKPRRGNLLLRCA